MKTALFLVGLSLCLPCIGMPAAEAGPVAVPTTSPGPVMTRTAVTRAQRFKRARHNLHLTPEPTLTRPQSMPDATPRPGSRPLP